jgi:hypothetical protein
MGIKSLVQVVAMIATIAFMNGHLPDILKRVNLAKIHLIKASKASTWGKAMIP